MFMHLERYFLLLKQVFPLGCLVPKRRGESKFLQIKSRLFAALVPTFLQWYTTSITTGFWQLLSPSKNDLEICDSTFDLPKCFSSPICPSIINGVGSTNSPTITKWVMKDVRVLRNMFIGLLHFSSRNYYLGGESHLRYVGHLIESVDSDFVANLEMKHSRGNKMNVCWTMKSFLSLGLYARTLPCYGDLDSEL